MLPWVHYAPPCLLPNKDQLHELVKKLETEETSGECGVHVTLEVPRGVDAKSLGVQVVESYTWLHSAVVHEWGHTLDEDQGRSAQLLVRHTESEYSRVCQEDGHFIGLNYVVGASVLEVFYRRDAHIAFLIDCRGSGLQTSFRLGWCA